MKYIDKTCCVVGNRLFTRSNVDIVMSKKQQSSYIWKQEYEMILELRKCEKSHPSTDVYQEENEITCYTRRLYLMRKEEV